MIIGWENSDSGFSPNKEHDLNPGRLLFLGLIEIVSYLLSVKYILLADLFLELPGC